MSQQSNNIFFEKFNAERWKVGIVVAGFNKDITDELLKSAKECCVLYKIKTENIAVHYVAGCVEIPLVLKKLAETGTYTALVSLGAIIRGDTAHFDFVAKAITEGVMRVQLDFGIPIGFGILTIDNKGQAIERLNSGFGATEAALQSAKVIDEII